MSTRAPLCLVDFYGGAAIADPAKAYSEMLGLGPVVWLEARGIHAICGFEALTACLRNHRVFSSGQGVSVDEDVNRILVGSTLNSDPPDHDRTRAITFSPLTPKALAEIKGRVEAEAVLIADRVLGMGTFDAALDLAPHLPLTIVRDLVGLGAHGNANMLG